MAKTSTSLLQSLLMFFILTRVLGNQKPDAIYETLMWTPNNPLFQYGDENATMKSFCYGGELRMKVHLMTNMPLICPFERLIMQTMNRYPTVTLLHENIWLVHDEESYRSCNINLTATFGGGSVKQKNMLLHKCKDPTEKTLLTYLIDFFADLPIANKMYFEGKKTYYFLSTSDGNKNSLDRTSGGHCNDTVKGVRMRFQVYVCDGSNDPECADPNDIGVFKCIPDSTPTPSSSSSPTPSPSPSPTPSPSPSPTPLLTSSATSSQTSSVTSSPTSAISLSTLSPSPSTLTAPTSTNNCTDSNTGQSEPIGKGNRSGDSEMQKERDYWKACCIVLFIICIFLLLVMLVVFYRLKKKYSVPCIYTSQISTSSSPTGTMDKTHLDKSFDNSAFDATDGTKKAPDGLAPVESVEMKKQPSPTNDSHYTGKIHQPKTSMITTPNHPVTGIQTTNRTDVYGTPTNNHTNNNDGIINTQITHDDTDSGMGSLESNTEPLRNIKAFQTLPPIKTQKRDGYNLNGSGNDIIV